MTRAIFLRAVCGMCLSLLACMLVENQPSVPPAGAATLLRKLQRTRHYTCYSRRTLGILLSTAMKNSLRFYKEIWLALTLGLLAYVDSAYFYPDNEVRALESRVDDCCGRLQELTSKLQECGAVLAQQQRDTKKRSVLDNLVDDFNEDQDWRRLSGGLEVALERSSPALKQLQYLGRDEMAPLSQAVDAEHAALLRVLLQHGLDVNMATSEYERQTMLHQAAMHGKMPIARLLLARGADVHARNRYSNTPLVEAAASNHLELVRLLADHGADVNGAGRSGRTALHMSMLHDHLPIAEFLLEAGADADVADRWGQTSLHLASFEGRMQGVELLLLQGTDVDARDTDGLTPLHLAAFGGHLEVARRLVQAGADPDAADLRGWTSLHKAASRGHLPLVRYLVDSGAMTKVRDHVNNTALSLAIIEDHEDVVQFLSTADTLAWIIINPDE